MRMGLIAAVAGVLFLVSSAGAGVVMNFGTAPAGDFILTGTGQLQFGIAYITDYPSGTGHPYDTVFISNIQIDPSSRATPFGAFGPVTYNVTTPTATFTIRDSNGFQIFQGTLATNQIVIFGGVTSIFNGSTLPADLTNFIDTTDPSLATDSETRSLELAGSAGVTVTIPFTIDANLSGNVPVTGSLSGTVNTTPTPEPATLALTGLGLMALFIRRKK